jgi:hypothetical protein
MRRLRFTSGLILGLLLGLAAGTLIGLLLPAARNTDPNSAAVSQLQALTRELDVAREAKERAERQLEVFAKLADQMTATFKTLEERFKALEEQERLRDTARDQPARHAPAPPAPPPPPADTPAAPPGDQPNAQPNAADIPPAAAAPQ